EAPRALPMQRRRRRCSACMTSAAGRGSRFFATPAAIGHDRAMSSPLDVFRDGTLAGRVALITGGGTGICRGIAAAYARFGADVAIVSRKQEVLDATATAIAAQTGRSPLAIAADVRDPSSIQRAIQATIDRFGKLDTVVNGAAGNFL